MCIPGDKYVELRVYETLTLKGVERSRAAAVARKVGRLYAEKRQRTKHQARVR